MSGKDWEPESGYARAPSSVVVQREPSTMHYFILFGVVATLIVCTVGAIGAWMDHGGKNYWHPHGDGHMEKKPVDIIYEPCYPRPECVNYDPLNPPPAWPQNIPGLEWETRGSIPANLRCNLTPPLININATSAVEAYETQSLDNNNGAVIFIDVRTSQEVYWIGVPTQVNSITMKNGTVFVPDLYMATLVPICEEQAPEVHFTLNGQAVSVISSDIMTTSMSAISYNIPVEFINTDTGISTLNPLWGKQADALIEATGADRIIFFCRSGQRSSIGCYYEFCPFRVLFPGILGYIPGVQMLAYEVESATTNGRGGFEGTDYSGTMLGYRGFPGRYTAFSGPTESASFKDHALPIKTGTIRKTIVVQPAYGELISVDSLDALPWALSP